MLLHACDLGRLDSHRQKRRQHALLGAGISDCRDYRSNFRLWWSRCRGSWNREAPVLYLPGGVHHHPDYRTYAPRPDRHLAERNATTTRLFKDRAGLVSSRENETNLGPERFLISLLNTPTARVTKPTQRKRLEKNIGPRCGALFGSDARLITSAAESRFRSCRKCRCSIRMDNLL